MGLHREADPNVGVAFNIATHSQPVVLTPQTAGVGRNALRGCERVDAQGCISVARASRRALRALLSLRYLVDSIKKCPHPEEAPHGSGLRPARGQAPRPS